jgi:hypothetical protein
MPKSPWKEIFVCKNPGELVGDTACAARTAGYDFFCHNNRIFAIGEGKGRRVGRRVVYDRVDVAETGLNGDDIDAGKPLPERLYRRPVGTETVSVGRSDEQRLREAVDLVIGRNVLHHPSGRFAVLYGWTTVRDKDDVVPAFRFFRTEAEALKASREALGLEWLDEG